MSRREIRRKQNDDNPAADDQAPRDEEASIVDPPSQSKPQVGTRQSVHEMITYDDEDTSTVDENFEVASLSSSIEDQLTWRGRLQVILHSIWFHAVILTLVLVDAVIVLVELLLEVGAFQNIDCRGAFVEEQARFCHYQLNSRPDCRPTPFLILNQTNVTEGNGTGFCHCGYRGGRTVCIIFGTDIGVNPALILHLFSLIILTIFLFEILLKLIAFRLKFFTHKFEVFDATVVTISWILDVGSIVREESFAQAASLIILLRIWRVVRIINGAVLSTKARADEKLLKARRSAREVIHSLHKAQDRLELETKAYEELKEIIKAHGLPLPEKPGAIPEYPYDKEEGISFEYQAEEEKQKLRKKEQELEEQPGLEEQQEQEEQQTQDEQPPQDETDNP